MTVDAALAATATLVATAFAAADARAMAAPPPAARAGLDDLAGHVRGRVRRPLGGRGAAAGRSRSFRTFYLFGAILNVPWLALGTVYLLAGRRLADGVRWGLVLAVRLRRRGDGHRRPCRAARAHRRAARGPRAVRCLSPASWPRSAPAWRPSSSSGARCGRPGASGGTAVPVRERAATPLHLAAGPRQRRHRRGHDRSVGQRHAGRTTRQGHGLRGDARGRRGDPVLRVPRRHAPAYAATCRHCANGALGAGPCRTGCGGARRRTAPSSGTCSGPGDPWQWQMTASSSRWTPGSVTT